MTKKSLKQTRKLCKYVGSATIFLLIENFIRSKEKKLDTPSKYSESTNNCPENTNDTRDDTLQNIWIVSLNKQSSRNIQERREKRRENLVIKSNSTNKVSGRIVEHTVPHVCSWKHHLELLMGPILSWNMLEKHHQFLKIKFL